MTFLRLHITLESNTILVSDWHNNINIDSVCNVNNVNTANNANNVKNVNNINKENCKSVKSATLAHHLGPIFGLVLQKIQWKTSNGQNHCFYNGKSALWCWKHGKIRNTGQTKTQITQIFQILYPIQGGTMWKLTSWRF